MTDYTKNIVSLVTLLCFMIGTGFTLFGIFRTNEMSEKNLDENFIIPSQVLNGLTVMFLLYLTSTNTVFSPAYKLLIIILLVGGMLIEIYLTNYADREAESIAAYVFIAINFLIRAFLFIDLIQSDWVKPFTSPLKPAQKIVKDTVMKPIEQAIKEVTKAVQEAPKPEKTEDTSGKELQDKWNKLKEILYKSPEGLDKPSESEAWKTVVRPAKESGRTDIKEVLKEATAVMKNSSGNPIPLNTVDSVGGARK